MSWAEIDLGAIRSNIAEINRILRPETGLMAIVKANAYGHGMLEVSRVCMEAGVACLAVANPQEALTLRENGIDMPVLILGWMPPEYAAAMVENHVDITVFEPDTAALLSRAAVAAGQPARIHLKIDTGMGRLGFEPNPESRQAIQTMASLPGIMIQGIFSHLASADEQDKTFAYQQLEMFKQFIAELETAGIKIPIHHLANSGAIMEMPEAQLDMVRAGIILYGLYPSDEVDHSIISLVPAMSLRSKVSFLKNLPAGRSVSYGRTYISKDEVKVATVPIGYADGYSRLLSNRGWAVIRGHRVPLIGRVCMDQIMFDVTGIDEVKIGDEVILFGKPEDGVTADDLAAIIGTINYEIVCSPHSRVVRTFKDGGSGPAKSGI